MRITDLLLRGTREQLEGNELTKGLNIQALIAGRKSNPTNADLIPLLRMATTSSSVNEGVGRKALRKEILKKVRDERKDILRIQADPSYRQQQREMATPMGPPEGPLVERLFPLEMEYARGAEARALDRSVAREKLDPPPISILASGRDLAPEYHAQQTALALSRDPAGAALNNPQSISELFQTKAARDFQYQSGVQGMESPGFRLTPEQQARVDTIERSDYLNQAARNIRAVETADANRALMGRGPLGGYGDDLPAMRNQEVLDQIGYNETAHTNANLATATENVTEGASSGNFTPGRLNIGGTQATNSLLGSLDRAGAEGMLATMGLGAVLGGTANYAMGGEFGEGAMMGGLAGGGISIGARAIRANAQGIEGYLQRQVLGDAAATTDRAANATAIAGMTDEAVSNLSVGGRMARSALMRNPETASLQSRHMVVGGSMLAGVAFTGRRNDKRRGFNAHRGNRI